MLGKRSLEKRVLLTGDRGFESISLQRGVWYELDFSGVQEDWQAPPVPHAPITRGTEGSARLR
jgi:hypothetical protein